MTKRTSWSPTGKRLVTEYPVPTPHPPRGPSPPSSVRRTFRSEQNRADHPAYAAYSRRMGDVIALPVRREQPQETGRQRRAEPVRGPGGLEPLWRESVGRELREERLNSGHRLIDVAEQAGVSPQYLSEVERGLKDPSSELLAAMAGALGLSVGELATRAASTTISPQTPVCLAA